MTFVHSYLENRSYISRLRQIWARVAQQRIELSLILFNVCNNAFHYTLNTTLHIYAHDTWISAQSFKIREKIGINHSKLHTTYNSG